MTTIQRPAVDRATRPAVEISGVGKRFSGRTRRSPARVALEGVDLTVRAGEFLCLLGPSGCG